MKISVLGTLVVLGLGLAAASPAQAQEFRGRARVDVRVPAPSYRVRLAPPIGRAEVRYAAPSTRHVWAPGYWSWNRGHHLWRGGRWVLPPRAGAVYVGPRWVSSAGAWSFYPESWQYPRTQYAPGYEYVSVPPSPRHYWVRGDWYRHGPQRAWRPGHWQAPRYGRVPHRRY